MPVFRWSYGICAINKRIHPKAVAYHVKNEAVYGIVQKCEKHTEKIANVPIPNYWIELGWRIVQEV